MDSKVLAIAVAFLAAACSSAGGDQPDAGHEDSGLGVNCTGATPSFSKDVEPVFARSCGGAEICHGGGLGPGGGHPTIWPYDALVNVKASRDSCKVAGDLVVPGSLSESYLMHKITGVDMCPETSRMPLGTKLDDKDIQTIADWICAGAKND